MFIHPKVLRHLFVVKAVYTTISLFGVLAWTISANGGKIGEFSYTTVEGIQHLTSQEDSGADLAVSEGAHQIFLLLAV